MMMVCMVMGGGVCGLLTGAQMPLRLSVASRATLALSELPGATFVQSNGSAGHTEVVLDLGTPEEGLGAGSVALHREHLTVSRGDGSVATVSLQGIRSVHVVAPAWSDALFQVLESTPGMSVVVEGPVHAHVADNLGMPLVFVAPRSVHVGTHAAAEQQSVGAFQLVRAAVLVVAAEAGTHVRLPSGGGSEGPRLGYALHGSLVSPVHGGTLTGVPAEGRMTAETCAAVSALAPQTAQAGGACGGGNAFLTLVGPHPVHLEVAYGDAGGVFNATDVAPGVSVDVVATGPLNASLAHTDPSSRVAIASAGDQGAHIHLEMPLGPVEVALSNTAPSFLSLDTGAAGLPATSPLGAYGAIVGPTDSEGASLRLEADAPVQVSLRRGATARAAGVGASAPGSRLCGDLPVVVSASSQWQHFSVQDECLVLHSVPSAAQLDIETGGSGARVVLQTSTFAPQSSITMRAGDPATASAVAVLGSGLYVEAKAQSADETWVRVDTTMTLLASGIPTLVVTPATLAVSGPLPGVHSLVVSGGTTTLASPAGLGSLSDLRIVVAGGRLAELPVAALAEGSVAVALVAGATATHANVSAAAGAVTVTQGCLQPAWAVAPVATPPQLSPAALDAVRNLSAVDMAVWADSACPVVGVAGAGVDAIAVAGDVALSGVTDAHWAALSWQTPGPLRVAVGGAPGAPYVVPRVRFASDCRRLALTAQGLVVGLDAAQVNVTVGPGLVGATPAFPGLAVVNVTRGGDGGERRCALEVGGISNASTTPASLEGALSLNGGRIHVAVHGDALVAGSVASVSLDVRGADATAATGSLVVRTTANGTLDVWKACGEGGAGGGTLWRVDGVFAVAAGAVRETSVGLWAEQAVGVRSFVDSPLCGPGVLLDTVHVGARVAVDELRRPGVPGEVGMGVNFEGTTLAWGREAVAVPLGGLETRVALSRIGEAAGRLRLERSCMSSVHGVLLDSDAGAMSHWLRTDASVLVAVAGCEGRPSPEGWACVASLETPGMAHASLLSGAPVGLDLAHAASWTPLFTTIAVIVVTGKMPFLSVWPGLVTLLMLSPGDEGGMVSSLRYSVVSYGYCSEHQGHGTVLHGSQWAMLSIALAVAFVGIVILIRWDRDVKTKTPPIVYLGRVLACAALPFFVGSLFPFREDGATLWRLLMPLLAVTTLVATWIGTSLQTVEVRRPAYRPPVFAKPGAPDDRHVPLLGVADAATDDTSVVVGDPVPVSRHSVDPVWEAQAGVVHTMKTRVVAVPVLGAAVPVAWALALLLLPRGVAVPWCVMVVVGIADSLMGVWRVRLFERATVLAAGQSAQLLPLVLLVCGWVLESWGWLVVCVCCDAVVQGALVGVELFPRTRPASASLPLPQAAGVGSGDAGAEESV